MRVWDFSPDLLCNKHLLAQHNEIHSIHSIINNECKGYANHPEVKRWQGRSASLVAVHDLTADEMTTRGFAHQSPLPDAGFIWFWPESWQSTTEQLSLLKAKGQTIKGCDCYHRITASLNSRVSLK